MATKVKQNANQVDKDEANNNNIFFMSQPTITAERKEDLKTSMSGVAIVTERKPFQSIHSMCLPFGGRIDQHRLSLLPSEKTEPDLFNETCCSQCGDNSSKSQGKTRFDARRQEQMQICSTDFKLVNLNSGDTRLVDGLLTTTLCSTEL